MWEDDRNKKGGRWLINLDKKQRGSCLDNFWLEVVRSVYLVTFVMLIFPLFADALLDWRIF